MKKIIVAATMVGALLTTTMANAQNVIKTKKVSKTEMQQSPNTAVAKKQTKMETDTKSVELKTTEKGTKTRTTTHKSKVVKTTKETKAVMKK